MYQDVIREVLEVGYGLKEVTIKKLDGYISHNYKISTGATNYVLKLYPLDQEIIDDVAAENKVLQSLKDIALVTPQPIPNSAGDLLHTDDQRCYRLLSYVDGEPWTVYNPEDEAIELIGRSLATIDVSLQRIQPIAIHARRLPWDPAHFFDNLIYLDLIKDAHQKSYLQYFINQWKTHIIHRLPTLRKAIIHNDANEHNLTHHQGAIYGIFDFGDMAYTYLINEVAVAATYIAFEHKDPIRAIESLLRGYHAVHPLATEEIDLLYYFIAIRLCTSILQAAHSAAQQPENEYAQSSNEGAWRLLKSWVKINPWKATNQWRTAVGLGEIYRDQHLRKRRDHYMPGSYSTSYEEPIHMVGAAFQYMYDAAGNTILDAYNNIIQVGHCHPKVVEAGQSALATLNTNTRYLYDSHARYAEHLLSYFPDHINQLYLVNSGSAAADLAIRLAKSYTGKSQVAVIKYGYHGNTGSTIDVSHYKYGKKGGHGKSADIVELDLPDIYRGRYTEPDEHGSYARDACKILDGTTSLAAFIAEPIIGCGGQVPLPQGYLKKVYEKVRSLGGVCISDEVQTGFGRVGSHFWGYGLQEVCPDIVVMGKPIGNGHPMAAVATTKDIADAFDNGMEFFSSFGGNPVSCAIGAAVLRVIEDEDLMAHAKKTGMYLMDQLRGLPQSFPIIGDIRGSGLFIGVEIIQRDRERIPDGTMAKKIINQLRERNILTSLDGPDNNVIKIKPPLRFNKENSAQLVDELHHILTKG